MKAQRNQILTVLLAILLAAPVFAKQEMLHVLGTVTDMQNAPIVGAKVRVKDANQSAITDIKGQFKLQVKKGVVLKVSAVGYETKEVKADKPKLNIVLKAQSVKVEKEIVVADVAMYIPNVPQMYKAEKRMAMGAVQSQNAYFAPSPFPVEQNTEEYSKHAENRFLDAKSDPLSTFSLDVDAASYSNVRRKINNGQMPEKDAVRVEEFVNYFSYDYPQPTDKHPVKINTEMHECPWAKDHKLVRIGVKAKEIPTDNLPASNFVFLLDVSGSMSLPNKLPLVKSSLKLLTNNLREKDRVAIVVYAGAAGEVLPSTSGADKQKIFEALGNLKAGGSTAGGAGIELAYNIAQKNFIKGGNNRIILCTDGDFNVGVSSEQGLEELVEEKRKTGVYLTVLGFGMGNYKDNKMQVLSEKGNGNHAYIDNLQEANKVLVNEFGSTMYAVAKDVKIQVEFNPAQVSAYRLVGYESRLLNKEDFNDDTKDAGELGAGHTVTAFYEIIPVGVENRYGGVDALKYQKTEAPKTANASSELMTVKLRYKPIDSDRSLKLEVPVEADEMPKASTDFNFAASVAMFGQLLKDSDFKGDASYKKVVSLAEQGLGKDKQGYRREFVRLVEAVEQMEK